MKPGSGATAAGGGAGMLRVDAKTAARSAGLIALAACGYYLCGWLGYAFALRPSGISAVWPASGFMLALLLLFDKRDWPLLIAGGFLGNVAADLGKVATTQLAIAGSAANGLETVLAAWVVVRIASHRLCLTTLREVGALVVGAAVVSNALTALFGTVVLVAGTTMGLWKAWFVWWTGDGLGMLIVAPAILTWVGGAAIPKKLRWTTALEAGVLFALLFVFAQVIHGQQPAGGRPVTLDPYMVFPLLFWAAIRFGPRGAASATFVLAGATLWNAARGVGPFVGVGHSPTAEILQLYAYLTLASLTSLIASAILHERKRLEESRAQLADILEAAPDFVTIGRVQGPPLYINRAARQALGIGETENVETLLAFRPPGFREYLENTILPSAIRDGSWRGETEHVARDGRTIPVSQVTVAHKDDEGRVVHLSTISRDISDQLRATAQIHLLARAIESSSEMISVTDVEDRFTFVNAAFLRTYGYSAREVIGQTPAMLRAPAQAGDPLPEILARSREDGWRGELTNVRKDGAEIVISLTTSPIRDSHNRLVGLLGVARDITERVRIEEALRQAQKMEAVGQLAGGVAHDFNNILTVIKGYAEVLAWDPLPTDEQRTAVAAIQQASEHATGLTRQLLAFGRRQVLQPRVLSLSHVVQDLLAMLRRLLGAHIAIDAPDTGEDAPVFADVTQVEQIILNLALNAGDAMPDGGRLTIRVDAVEFDGASSASHPDVVAGRYAAIEVTDSGAGMDATTRARVFEPFFTTKPVGQGTGLGLSTVYGIVRQMQGAITVDSEPGKGTTFRVFLPRHAASEPTAAEGTSRSGQKPVTGGRETIVLVEDEEAVRTFASRVLDRAGYRVLTAANPLQALSLIGEQTSRIDLVLTDMRMPGGTGADLAGTLGLRHPGVRVLFMSGYSELADTIDADHFLPKPFGIRELTDKVREVLDRP